MTQFDFVVTHYFAQKGLHKYIHCKTLKKVYFPIYIKMILCFLTMRYFYADWHYDKQELCHKMWLINTPVVTSTMFKRLINIQCVSITGLMNVSCTSTIYIDNKCKVSFQSHNKKSDSCFLCGETNTLLTDWPTYQLSDSNTPISNLVEYMFRFSHIRKVEVVKSKCGDNDLRLTSCDMLLLSMYIAGDNSVGGWKSVPWV